MGVGQKKQGQGLQGQSATDTNNKIRRLPISGFWSPLSVLVPEVPVSPGSPWFRPPSTTLPSPPPLEQRQHPLELAFQLGEEVGELAVLAEVAGLGAPGLLLEAGADGRHADGAD